MRRRKPFEHMNGCSQSKVLLWDNTQCGSRHLSFKSNKSPRKLRDFPSVPVTSPIAAESFQDVPVRCSRRLSRAAAQRRTSAERPDQSRNTAASPSRGKRGWTLHLCCQAVGQISETPGRKANVHEAGVIRGVGRRWRRHCSSNRGLRAICASAFCNADCSAGV